MPVFDGLLDEADHDKDIASLLFTFAEWHALAKLRMHTDLTLGWLGQCTKSLGRQLRRFQKHTCLFFDTRELPSEEAARSRRRTKKAGSTKRLGRSKQTTASQSSPPLPQSSRKKKTFNLSLIKLHALGDYTRTFKFFGTSDSYSTQPVSFISPSLCLL